MFYADMCSTHYRSDVIALPLVRSQSMHATLAVQRALAYSCLHRCALLHACVLVRRLQPCAGVASRPAAGPGACIKTIGMNEGSCGANRAAAGQAWMHCLEAACR